MIAFMRACCDVECVGAGHQSLRHARVVVDSELKFSLAKRDGASAKWVCS